MTLVTDQFWTDLKVNMTPDTVQVRTSSTVNSYGERSFAGGTTTYDAYIRRVNSADLNDRDDFNDVEWVVYILDDSLALQVDDQLTLPSPVSGVRPIRRVDTRKDPNGQVGVVAYMGGG